MIKKGAGIPDDNYFNGVYNYIHNFDNSKIIAGIMLLILNISTKYVEFKLSPSVESFIKNSFQIELLIFITVWVGTKNLLISLIITLLFIIVFDYLLNEESQYSILPESFTQYYNNLHDTTHNKIITEKDIKNAKKILDMAEKQKLFIS